MKMYVLAFTYGGQWIIFNACIGQTLFSIQK